MLSIFYFIFFFFKQKTAYEMRISDWSSDVCSSDLCVPSEQFSHDRREQCGKYRARIAHSGYAHRFSLMLGRIPARCEGQRHCKAGACKAKDETNRQSACETVDASHPGEEQARQDNDLADSARCLGPDPV